jgi:hypothetical protein
MTMMTMKQTFPSAVKTVIRRMMLVAMSSRKMMMMTMTKMMTTKMMMMTMTKMMTTMMTMMVSIYLLPFFY